MLERPNKHLSITPAQQSAASEDIQPGCRPSGAQPEFTYDDFQKFAAIAQVRDDAKKIALYYRVGELVQFAWRTYDFCNVQGPRSARVKLLSHKVQVAGTVLIRDAAKLKRLLKELNEAEQLIGREQKTSLTHRLASAVDLIGEPTGLARSAGRSSGRGPGCPPGSRGVNREVFKVLVIELRAAVIRAHGRLTFNKDDESKGGLSQALRMLTPFLPPHTIPKPLPLRTIRRLIGPNASPPLPFPVKIIWLARKIQPRSRGQ